MNRRRRETILNSISGLHRMPRTDTTAPDDTNWISHMPTADIAGTIAFSKLRCFMSVVSLLLLASDIPRTGLGVQSLSQFYSKQLAPGSAIFFGPYAYPVLHIECNSSDINAGMMCIGEKGGKPLTQVPTWSYAFDTTSIGLRGAAELFNVSNFPAYLLNQGDDPRRGDPMASMDLNTTFLLLDGLSSAIQAWRHPDSRTSSVERLVYERFATQHNWIDRLYHYLLRPVNSNLRWRTHTVNLYAKRSREMNESLEICTSTVSTAFSMPQWCGDYMKWRTYNFANKAMPDISISQHIDQRVMILQETHPGDWLDVLVMNTVQPLTTASMTYSTFFHNDACEIVVMVRGRECNPDLSSCRTRWVDDFRYERVAITTNIAEWYAIAAALRGTAQVYVWLHLTMLFYLCGSVTLHQLPPSRQSCLKFSQLFSTFSTMMKIPFHVVVYGSHIPIVLYVLALLTDGKFIDSFLDAYWSTVGGVNYKFNAVDFLQTASVQMRNVWALALLAKLWTYFQTRGSSWHSRQGILGIHGLTIGFTSFLSIFGPYKAKKFRDTSVATATFLSPSGSGRSTRMSQFRVEPAPWFNSNAVELGNSLSMALLVLLSVVGLHAVFVGLATLSSRPFFRQIFFRHSMVVPFTIGSIIPSTALAVCFRAYIKSDLRCPQIVPMAPAGGSRHVDRASCSDHEWERSLEEREATVMSVIQLMNVTMMSDPWTLFRLRVTGMELFVYEIWSTESRQVAEKLSSELNSIALLPFHPSTMASQTGLDVRQFKMICRVNSRDLPLWVLLKCG